jgi:hypothetical protein
VFTPAASAKGSATLAPLRGEGEFEHSDRRFAPSGHRLRSNSDLSALAGRAEAASPNRMCFCVSFCNKH